jgi:hypothetical protein
LPREQAGTSSLAPAGIDGADCAWIMRNEPLEQLMFDRNVIGSRFGEACRAASRSFAAHIATEAAEAAAGGVAELILLSKGYAYDLRGAVRDELGIDIAVSMMATRRAAVQGATAQIEVPYTSLDAFARTLLIGDTIASGATVCAALGRYLEQQRLDRVVIFSIAGSIVGIRRISAFCAARGVDAIIVLGLAAFGLAPNGFDLSFAHPDTVCAVELRHRAERAFAGRPVSAVGWDFGAQLVAPDKYRALCWVEERYWDLEGTGVFALARRPTDRRQIQKEYAAYRDRLPDIDALIAADA